MVDRSRFKCYFFRCASQSILSAIRANEQLYFDIPREDSVKSLKDGYLQKEFDVKHETDNDFFLAAQKIG